MRRIKVPRAKERGEIFDFLMRRRQNFAEQSGRHSFIVQSRGEIRRLLRFLFLEEAAESVDGIVSSRLIFVGGGSRFAAEASEFGFEKIFGEAADVRNKFGIGRGALNLERNFHPTAAAAAATTGTGSASGDLAEETAESACCATYFGGG